MKNKIADAFTAMAQARRVSRSRLLSELVPSCAAHNHLNTGLLFNFA